MFSGFSRQVQRVWTRRNAQGADLPLHWGTDSDAEPYLPSHLWVHLGTLGKAPQYYAWEMASGRPRGRKIDSDFPVCDWCSSRLPNSPETAADSSKREEGETG